jgi:hypothetical protein
MGIFKVQIPLLYGEGGNAFIRLQEAIMKESADQSLFACKSLSAQNAFFCFFARNTMTAACEGLLEGQEGQNNGSC